MAVEIPSWLDIDYTKRILRLAEDDCTLQVTHVSAKPATSKGDNYTSDMIRVTVEFTRHSGDKKTTEKKSMLFKFEPMEEGPRRDLIRQIDLFDTEIAALTDTVKKMNILLEPESRLCAKVYHIRMEQPLSLVMEDLSLLGFRMADRQVGLDMDHALLAVRSLAKFHAASVALCEKEPKHKNQYKNGMFCPDYPDEMQSFTSKTLEAVADVMEDWPEFEKSDVNKLRAFIPYSYERAIQCIKRDDNDFNVINHGDCWVNNMMFRYDDNGKPIEQIFVDLQLCIYTSPAIDLHYFLSTSVNPDIYENKRNFLLEEYLKKLTSVMKRLGCKTTPLTMEVLQRHLKQRMLYEFIASALVLPLIILNKDEVKDINELIKADQNDHPGMRYETFHKVMSKRIPRYIEIGLFDV